MSQILVIDDDKALRTMVCEYLLENNFAAMGVGSVQAADGLFAQHNIALVILDINMPVENGLSFLQRLRQRNDDTAVLILSGRAHEADRVRGLQLGADDYLVKPFGPRELLARVQALLRRTVPKAPRHLAFGAFHFDFDKIALYCGIQEFSLSSGERALLKVFAEHPNKTLSRHTLLSLLGDEFGESFERSIDVRVTRLRTRLGDTANEAQYIRTVRGQGYCFTPNAP
ncbi:MAG: response regulator [Gallionella sp.]